MASTTSKDGHGCFRTNEPHVSSDNDLGNDVIVDFTVGLNDLDTAVKGFHSSLNDVISSLEIVQPRNSPSTSLDSKKFSQTNGINATEVVNNKITHTKSFKPSSSHMCGWVAQISLCSLDVFTELESSIASTLQEISKNFFKSYAEYDALKSSKMTKVSHEKALYDAQRGLDSAKVVHEKLDGSMGKLSTTLEHVEKDLEALISEKKNIIMLLNKYQEKLSESQDNVTMTKGEIYTIEVNHMLSNDEVEILSKLEVEVETSRQEIIGFKHFP
ncbi:hypothetical protein R3W88_033491 [Solanum pinnatisectum]|uniref:DUF641 domain-containing protein n=1 Tax=Solanum pinnatisectum TaxID=50273 RepID=A0AAV9K2P9_9SOLN|nr:hypothetical protein R3W88_033491 [Solanum pinnatisectum]